MQRYYLNLPLLNAVEKINFTFVANFGWFTLNLAPRFKDALRASLFHLVVTLVIAVLAAALVFLVWYPYPYQYLAGGRELFLLVVTVDVVCGPLLTAVVFNRAKPRAELIRDLALIASIQFIALVYGVYTVWQVRPLFLVMEVERFKVIYVADFGDVDLLNLPTSLQPSLFSGPHTVALRAPKDFQERNKVLLDSVQGGRDYAERPEFYLPYEGANALKTLIRAKPLSVFLQKQPDQSVVAQHLALQRKAEISEWMYLPVVARQNWVAVLDKQGQIQGFLKGDGF